MNRQNIQESNKSCVILENIGYIPQGLNKEMTKVSVLKDGVLYFFENYIQAKNELIKKQLTLF